MKFLLTSMISSLTQVKRMTKKVKNKKRKSKMQLHSISYLISLNPMLLKNIAHVGPFKHFVFVYLSICVIVYLCILHLIHGNVIFDILESHAFQKYSTCWVLSLSLSLSNLKNLKNLKKVGALRCGYVIDHGL